jgi:Protein kinase domain
MVGDSYPRPRKLSISTKRASPRRSSIAAVESEEEQKPERKKRTVNQSNILIEMDSQGIIKYISPIVKTVLGYEPAQIVNTSPIPFIHDRNVFLEATYSRKPTFDTNVSCKKADGSLVNCIAQGLNNIELGKVKGSTWVMKEIEEEIPTIDLALCQFCERSVPAILFATHHPICLSIHTLEMQLSLTKDELKSLRQTLTEKSTMLREEHDIETQEHGEAGVPYMKYLDTLCHLSALLATFIDDAILIPIPKWDDGIDYSGDSPSLDKLSFTTPSEEHFFPSDLPECVDEAVLEIASELHSISLTISSLCHKMLNDILCLKPNVIQYRTVTSNEDALKMEIGMHVLQDEAQEDVNKKQLRLEKKIMEANAKLVVDLNFNQEKDLLLGSRVIEILEDKPKMRRGSRVPRMVIGANKSVEIQSPFSPSSPIIEQRSVPSIKDYHIIKPISKGAFGSVFLAKKKITGEYFAIKVLKKADMVSKNQVMNVKAERTILTQLDSPYVVKLFYTFQSQEHIYLVMEYLNGGDCASLLKNMGQLDENWARRYIAEMVLGLEFLHDRDIVHR